MLRNLDKGARRRFLGAMNVVWQTSSLPHTWLIAEVVPIRKPRRPATDITSNRPVCLISAAFKLMETLALGRLNWIAGAVDFLNNRQAAVATDARPTQLWTSFPRGGGLALTAGCA